MNDNSKREEQDFIVRFFSVYSGLRKDTQELVLAFVQGMEFQRNLEHKSIETTTIKPHQLAKQQT